ncbi:type VI secretion protein IcmF/TssM N-terminal domain-containing protein [Azospirillum sp. ST 5-10]|uniref:type VI secretion protein IcmF/TssM N-terminal domain-containing protein n=1 Tax=unclassified Azospirillum TaxID=2630922 RepID=UPI003F49DFBE
MDAIALLLDNPVPVGLLLAAAALLVLLLVGWTVRRAERGAEERTERDGMAGSPDPVARRPGDLRALAASFTATLRALRGLVPGPGWRYEAPWVLLLGDPGSGKSALAAAIDLHRPFDLNADPELAERGCAWHVFERGIVLDPAGGILWGDGPDDGGERAGEAGWRRLLQLLLRHRPERGLDGVVVAVPCTDLIGPDRLDATALAGRARRLRRRLRELQQQLGLRLPVYLVVTKCDAVVGFTSFWGPQAAQRGREMFGWSNGQTLETTYGPHLVPQAFDAVARDLHRAVIGTAVTAGGVGDMAFLFPAELQKLAAPLGRFADRLFRGDSFQDPHFFRGLYFTGDAGAWGAGGRSLPGPEAPAAGAAAGLPAGLVPEMLAPQGVRPLFVTDLFGEKIFREARVVQPARRSLVARSRAVRNAQFALAGLALVLAVGLWHSYRMLEATKATLLRPLWVIEQADERMDTARRSGQSLTAYRDLRDVAPGILDAFKTVSGRDLLVPFIPTSWFSELDDDVKDQLVTGFRLVVLDPMRYELINRWNDLQARYAGPPPAPAQPLQATDIAAFQRMYGYLDEIDQLAADVARYRNAQRLPPDSFAQLTQSLLGIDLGHTLRNDARLYGEVMKRVTVRPLDTERNLAPSRETLVRLVHEATLALAADGPIAREFGALANALERAEVARFGTDGGAVLRDLATALVRTRTLLGNAKLGWLFVRHPQDHPFWPNLLPRIRDNLFLGPPAADEVLTVATVNVQELRTALLALRTPGLGSLLQADDANDGALRLVPALDELAGALPEILRAGFMAEAAVRRPQAPAVASSAILWAPEPLETAVGGFRAFEGLEAGALARLPDTLRPMISALVAGRLEESMMTAVADAMVVERRGQDFRTLADETGLLREVRQFARAARPLGDLLSALGRAEFQTGYATLGGILDQHLVAMLGQADRIADEGAPYLPYDAFRDWDGTLPLNYEGWQVLSDVELAQYLDNTRGRFDWLGSEIAGPIVAFAVREQTPPSLRGDPHVLKWQRILIEQQRYKADNPNSSLAVLERYIRFDLGEAVRPESCLQQLAVGGGGGAGDFFLQRRESLRRMALAQCQRVAADTMSSDYAALANDFNALLAGRYPFAERQGADTPEASVDALTAFLERFAAAEPAIRRGLGTPAAGSRAAAALDFVDRMAAVRAFFAPFLAPDSTAPAGFDVAAEFRVNRARESGGNQIIEWTVTLGDQRITQGGGTASAPWSPGMPAAVSLRWAKDAPVVPLSIIGQDGTVEPDRTIRFAYADRWSLLRLLQDNRAPAADFPKQTDPQPHTLRFSAETGNVPAGGGAAAAKPLPGGRTSVFVRLVLSTPNPDGKTRTVHVLPPFPYAAPRLDGGTQAALAPAGPLSLRAPAGQGASR